MTKGADRKNTYGDAAADAKIKMRINAAEAELFADEELRRRRMGRRERTLVTMGILVVVVYFVCIFLPDNVALNADYHSFAWYVDMTGRNISVFAGWLGGDEQSSARFHATQYIIVALVGMALSVSGAVYQGAFRNALASPSTLGVQTGGALGGTIFVLLFYEPSDEITFALDAARGAGVLDRYGRSLFILAGCFVMVGLVLLAAKRMSRGGRLSTIGLILSGMVFGGAVGSILGLIRYYMLLNNTEDARAYALRYVMMGTFDYTYTPTHLLFIGLPVAVCTIIVMVLRKRLNLLAFGEDEARTMGVNVGLTRTLTIAVVTVMTAIVISFCGMIGFIGFMTPHVVRRMVGPDFNYLLPGSGLFGAIIMMVIFHIGKAVGLASTIGIMTSLVGGSVFMGILIYYRRRGHADWA
ncbi:MAG: iron ABC transporter permease [Clostridiales Family XIII bacterium]|jgi:iron complex transport system permease protein|nr:iron ABC transporter permease [Clostridiales Family XIII bacterium]